jgi:hypothetical protein
MKIPLRIVPAICIHPGRLTRKPDSTMMRSAIAMVKVTIVLSNAFGTELVRMVLFMAKSIRDITCYVNSIILQWGMVFSEYNSQIRLITSDFT